MRTRNILAALLLMVAGMQTASAQKVVINTKDNQTVKYEISQIESITFEEADDIIIDEHEWVDLGLPSGTLWATCNVGANSPEDYGDYFAWGETTGYNGGKTKFDWSTYKYYDATYQTVTKYCTISDYGVIDNKTGLEPEDDAATANWGSGWQMPSIDQIEELINSGYTTTTWTTQNGVNGRMIVSKSNSKSIFLPAAGYRGGEGLLTAGSYGYYWSRSLDTSDSRNGHSLYFNSSNIHTNYYGGRICGRSVRPVRVQTR